MTDIERNRQIVVDFYTGAFGNDPEQAVKDHLGDHYIQHNPQAADGAEAFLGFVRRIKTAFPAARLTVKRVVAEGDLVVTHSEMTLVPGQPGQALADFFRVEDGKVVEHWDVIQPVPTESANSNGMF
ncbi:ester cyclase [Kribbella sp. NPDC051587]|uniref:nuclear transport factor 2 family protein n=1 Tax=Kribbella sp. NPDC051587 TaxID=3364119 RepID=UPI0037B43510